MKYDFDTVIACRDIPNMKWCPEMVTRFGLDDHFDKNAIALFTADMDFRCV